MFEFTPEVVYFAGVSRGDFIGVVRFAEALRIVIRMHPFSVGPPAWTSFDVMIVGDGKAMKSTGSWSGPGSLIPRGDHSLLLDPSRCCINAPEPFTSFVPLEVP